MSGLAPILGLAVPREVLALGAMTGLTYGLLAIGLVVAYRASRVINFAHGQVGALAAVLLFVMTEHWNVPYWSAFAAALAIGAALSAAIELAVVRRLRNVPPLITTVGTLGVSQVLFFLTAAVGSDVASGALFPQPAGLPSTRFGALTITPASWAMLILGPLAAVALGVALRRTHLGTAIRASAASPDGARLLGVSAPRMAALAWALAGGLAAFTACLVLPAGTVPSTNALGPALLVRALAAAALAGMSSLPIAMTAGLGIGVIEQVANWNAPGTGLPELILLGVIVAALALRPPPGPRRGERADWTMLARFPALPAAARAVPLIRWSPAVLAVAALVVAALMPALLSRADLLTLTTAACFALVGLSVWVVTSLVGELSLGQFAVAAIGGLCVIELTRSTGSVLLGVLAAPVAGAMLALALGLPALRTQGTTLAVSTLAFAVAAQAWLLPQSWALGATGAEVRALRIAGATVSGPQGSYLLALGALLACLLGIVNLARSGVGRRLRAVRDNDQAAGAFGISATAARSQAFGVGGAIAGLGGALLALSVGNLTSSLFTPDASIQVVAIAVLGGLAISAGALIGALYLIALPEFVQFSSAALAATAAGWLALILITPGGIAGALEPLRRRVVGLLMRATGHDTELHWDRDGRPEPALRRDLTLGGVARQRPSTTGQALMLDGVSRRFGGVHAVENVTLEVADGEIVGIVGPNGAGKTTLFDLASGIVAPHGGRIVLGGQDVTPLSTAVRAKRGLVRSFQDARLFPTLTVAETVALGLERRDPTGLLPALVGLPGSERAKRARAADLIEAFGLQGWSTTAVHELSTGTRRVVELACMVALEPRVLLLDEPSSGLAQAELRSLADLLKRMRTELGLAMLVIEHDLPLVLGLADRVVVLAAGEQVCAGTPAQVRADPRAHLALGLQRPAEARAFHPAEVPA